MVYFYNMLLIIVLTPLETFNLELSFKVESIFTNESSTPVFTSNCSFYIQTNDNKFSFKLKNGHHLHCVF